ncbi:MAG: gliding motility-associated C-terminal domain-containing protein, partial [Bacteroidia bacterium]|nr:gliding motility-associated C-terminal domain-containing protein [Bacteroidia bacterium]
VTDANNCTTVSNIEISEPDTALNVLLSKTDVLCKNDSTGMAQTIINGGTSPYDYLWNTGVQTQGIASLPAGIYSITVTDANNCTASESIIINEPSDILSATIYTNGVACYGSTNVTASVNVNGGTSPYSYYWSTGDSGSLITNLAPGNYYVTITDANQCTTTNTITIIQSSFLETDFEITLPHCNISRDGRIEVHVHGGIEPYFYLWNTTQAQTDSVASDLDLGIYIVSVTDANSCIKIDTIELTGQLGTCLFIPNAFTPNNDGTNDDWKIQGIEYYPLAEIEIYSRWGIKLFHSTGSSYNNDIWDGTYKGKPLPFGAYLYILNLGDGSETITGTVTIIR